MRLWFLSPSKNPDPNDPAITAGVYTEIALEFAFMLSNITCLKPFLQPFHPEYFVSTVDDKASTYLSTKGSGSRGDAYLMISAARSTTGSKTGSATIDETEVGTANPPSGIEGGGKAPAFRPDKSSHRAMVLSDHLERAAAAEMAGSEEMIISKTQAWTVSYEEDQPKLSTI